MVPLSFVQETWQYFFCKCLCRYLSYFSWVCDDEPDCGSTLQGTLDISDEDPVRCRGNVSCLGNQFLCKVWIVHILTNHILELSHRKVKVLQNQCWLIKLAALQLFLKLLLILWHNFVLLASEFCRHNTAVADFAKKLLQDSTFYCKCFENTKWNYVINNKENFQSQMFFSTFCGFRS